MAAVLTLAACGADASRSAPVATLDEASRPLSDGRQRSETFLEETPQTGDLFDDESPSSREGDSTTSSSAPATSATPSTTVDGASATTGPAGSTPDGSLPDGSTTTSPAPADDSPFPATSKALARFATVKNAADAVSITIIRDGEIIVQEVAGQAQDESDLEDDSPIVVSGVSKLITALAIGRLAEAGLVDMAAPVPWAALGLSTHRKWEPVTISQLIEQTSGMPAKNNLWKTSTESCATNLTALLKAQPVSKRQGKRTDANGNACLLGLLIEQVTGESLEAAVQRLVFDPVDVEGFHLVGEGLLPTDGGLVDDQQLVSTGGAGTFVVSTEGLAAVFAELSDADRAIFTDPAVMRDQYGWGHTGIAKNVSSCLWILEEGLTVLAASAAGTSVNGGVTCDRFVPAIATDLELDLGSAKPERNK